MSSYWQMIAINMGSIACVISAAFLAYKGKAGWGWFLFVALLLHVYPTSWKG